MAYTYNQMIDEAKEMGINIDKCWSSSDDKDLGYMMDLFAKEHPDLFWAYMRKKHAKIHQGHYSESMARYDVDQITYVDRDKKAKQGHHWTCEQIEEATKSFPFPAGTNKWDKYVAFNVFYSDCCLAIADDAVLLDAAFQFFFADKDFMGKGKVWQYVNCLKN